MSCKYWATSCNFISANSIKDHIKQLPIDPHVTLAYYMTSQAQDINSLTYNDDPTVKLLYTITNNMTRGGETKKKKL